MPAKSFIDLKNRIDKLKIKTLDLLTKLKKEGKKVIGYGASTKGNTLLQYYGIGNDLMEFIAEKQKQKIRELFFGKGTANLFKKYKKYGKRMKANKKK